MTYLHSIVKLCIIISQSLNFIFNISSNVIQLCDFENLFECQSVRYLNVNVKLCKITCNYNTTENKYAVVHEYLISIIS